jgi:hypothetical protein
MDPAQDGELKIYNTSQSPLACNSSLPQIKGVYYFVRQAGGAVHLYRNAEQGVAYVAKDANGQPIDYKRFNYAQNIFGEAQFSALPAAPQKYYRYEYRHIGLNLTFYYFSTSKAADLPDGFQQLRMQEILESEAKAVVEQMRLVGYRHADRLYYFSNNVDPHQLRQHGFIPGAESPEDGSSEKNESERSQDHGRGEPIKDSRTAVEIVGDSAALEDDDAADTSMFLKYHDEPKPYFPVLKDFIGQWKRLPWPYKAAALFAIAIGITGITLAAVAGRYTALAWLVPHAPFVMLMGFLLTAVTLFVHLLHTALQSVGSRPLKAVGNALGRGNLLAAMLVTAGVSMILLPQLTYFFPGTAFAHFFSPLAWASGMFMGFGIAIVALTLVTRVLHLLIEEQRLSDHLNTQYINTGGWAKALGFTFAVAVPAVMLSLRFVPSLAGEHLTHLFGQMVGGIASAGTFWIAGAITMSVAGLVGYAAYMLMQPSNQVVKPSTGFMASVKDCCAWLSACFSRSSSTNRTLLETGQGAAPMPEERPRLGSVGSGSDTGRNGREGAGLDFGLGHEASGGKPRVSRNASVDTNPLLDGDSPEDDQYHSM